MILHLSKKDTPFDVKAHLNGIHGQIIGKGVFFLFLHRNSLKIPHKPKRNEMNEKNTNLAVEVNTQRKVKIQLLPVDDSLLKQNLRDCLLRCRRCCVYRRSEAFCRSQRYTCHLNKRKTRRLSTHTHNCECRFSWQMLVWPNHGIECTPRQGDEEQHRYNTQLFFIGIGNVLFFFSNN